MHGAPQQIRPKQMDFLRTRCSLSEQEETVVVVVVPTGEDGTGHVLMSHFKCLVNHNFLSFFIIFFLLCRRAVRTQIELVSTKDGRRRHFNTFRVIGAMEMKL